MQRRKLNEFDCCWQSPDAKLYAEHRKVNHESDRSLLSARLLESESSTPTGIWWLLVNTAKPIFFRFDKRLSKNQ